MAEQPEKDGIQHALRRLRGGPGRAVLIVEPNPDLQSRLARLVTVHGHRVIGTSSLDGALALLGSFPVDLVLVSEELGNRPLLPAIGEIVSLQPNARIVVLTNGDDDLERQRPQALEYAKRPVGAEALQALLSS